MKKVLIVAIAVLAACMMVFAQGQGKSKIAVYARGNAIDTDVSSALNTEILFALVKGGRYQAIERADAFLAEIDKEQVKQRSGAIDDNQISKLGKQAGIQFVCIADVTTALGSNQVSTRIINVETAAVEHMGKAYGDLKTMDDLVAISAKVVSSMFDGAVAVPSTQTLPKTGATASTSTGGASSGSSFTDSRDGKTYRAVKIGNQTWMAENLNYQTGNSWCYDNNGSNCQKYGRLYDWNTAIKACPAGWRLPNRKDWDDLIQAAGGNVAGKKLKSDSQWNGTNDYGFSALPGGFRFDDSSFAFAGGYGHWWSATEEDRGNAWYRYISPRGAIPGGNPCSSSRVVGIVSGQIKGKSVASADIFGKGGFAADIDAILANIKPVSRVPEDDSDYVTEGCSENFYGFSVRCVR